MVQVRPSGRRRAGVALERSELVRGQLRRRLLQALVAGEQLLAEGGEGRPAAARAAGRALDHGHLEGAVEAVDQQPSTLVVHAHGASGGRDGAALAHALEQRGLARPDAGAGFSTCRGRHTLKVSADAQRPHRTAGRVRFCYALKPRLPLPCLPLGDAARNGEWWQKRYPDVPGDGTNWSQDSVEATMHRISEMRSCIEECLRCYQVCASEASLHCLEAGGKHVRPGIPPDAGPPRPGIYRTSAHLMLLGGGRASRHSCWPCAEICEACARSCEAVGEMRNASRSAMRRELPADGRVALGH